MLRSRSAFGALLLGLALVAAACGGAAVSDPDLPAPTSPSEETTVPTTEPQPDPSGGDARSALDDMFDPTFPEPLIDPTQVLSGGPPPDGIPPVDDPQFVTVEEADAYLTDQEPVVTLSVEGDTRAYPVQVLIWHEIVNDTVGGVPVAVTYCPLCNSAVSYVREVDGGETTFGTSGRLFNSALVMYDRATESLWTHYDGRAVIGVLTGAQLEPLSSPLISWADFRAAHPDGMVLDRDRTGTSRPYGTNPYQGYDNPDRTPFLFTGEADDRAKAMQRVTGVTLNGESVAWTLEALSGGAAKATAGQVGGTDVVIFWKAGQATALEANGIDDGRDVGSVGVFLPEAGGQSLTFVADGERFVDQETGSEWNIAGQAVAGPLSGSELEQIHHLDTFWFAWSSYQPGTSLIEESA